MSKAPKIEDTVPAQLVGEFVEEHLVQAVYDQDGVQALAAIGKDGKEYGDPTPMAPPIGYNTPPDLQHMIKRMVHAELSQIADDQGFDTFEEGDDFEVEDEDPIDRDSPYEHHFDPPASPPQAGPQSPAPEPPLPSDGPKAAPGGGGAPGGVASPPPAPGPADPKTTT